MSRFIWDGIDDYFKLPEDCKVCKGKGYRIKKYGYYAFESCKDCFGYGVIR